MRAQILAACSLVTLLLAPACLTDNATAFKDCGCSEGQICVDPDTAPTCVPVPTECGSAVPAACEEAMGTQACADSVCGTEVDTAGAVPNSVCHDEEGDVYRFFYCG